MKDKSLGENNKMDYPSISLNEKPKIITIWHLVKKLLGIENPISPEELFISMKTSDNELDLDKVYEEISMKLNGYSKDIIELTDEEIKVKNKIENFIEKVKLL